MLNKSRLHSKISDTGFHPDVFKPMKKAAK